ncbi:acyltransferase [Paenibacillus sp. 1011MAR3C5]|uniref:acyltransferase n=1 Tax=Paenibacillus sp. 1011MAR3C5 TaxID=1675787 RepID=UPI000E6C4363|nr:acyltransferase [Paenibacillus sp. 1011MAR3C5]RJE88505.1 acyltransferase [Paenibacillus sp. 1011MAR3C5]
MDRAIVNQPKGSRLSEIDLVRAIAIIGVLAVHATSFSTVEMLVYPNSYPVYNFINIFLKFGTPVFIFLSSFVLFLNYYHRPLSKDTILIFYKKRWIHIIIPYLVFSTIYYLLVYFTRDPAVLPTNPLLDFAQKIGTGTAYSHLYFVFISIQFYLLFPIALWLLQKWPGLLSWLIPSGLILQWLFFGLNELIPIPNVGSWAFSYISFYLLGAYWGIHYPAIKQWSVARRQHSSPSLRRWGIAVCWLVWLLAGLWHASVWFDLRMAAIARPLYVYTLLWNVYTILSALLFLWAGAKLLNRFSPDFFWLAKLRKLGSLSFGIYLIHPLFLAAYRVLRPEGAPEMTLHLWYGAGFLLALLGSWAAVWFAHRYLPAVSGLFFGKNELRTLESDSIKSNAASTGT